MAFLKEAIKKHFKSCPTDSAAQVHLKKKKKNHVFLSALNLALNYGKGKILEIKKVTLKIKNFVKITLVFGHSPPCEIFKNSPINFSVV